MENMTHSTPTHLNSFSLGVEELALALGLAGQVDLGKVVLSNAHKKRDETYLNALLSSASHSLLARKLVVGDGQLVLEKNFQQALAPLLKYDFFLFFSLVDKKQLTKMEIRVQKNGDFTAQINKENKVYLLENARSDSLVDYLKDILGAIAIFARSPELVFTGPIQMDTISMAMEKPAFINTLPGMLEKSGWSSTQARALSDDFSDILFRTTLIKVMADSSVTAKQYAHVPRPTLLLLRGLERTWTFTFSTSDPGTTGTATLVDQHTFSRILTDFLK
jgi:hypothetical protein